MALFRFLAALSGMFVLAFSAGLMLGMRTAPGLRGPLREVPDPRPPVPTVVLGGIRDGQLWGTAAGELRLFVGDAQVHADGSGTLLVPAGPLLIHDRTLIVPEGMRYVASRNGSRFYPVESASARQLSPRNRVYFPDAAAARAAGYR